jgi:hypothetical protein
MSSEEGLTKSKAEEARLATLSASDVDNDGNGDGDGDGVVFVLWMAAPGVFFITSRSTLLLFESGPSTKSKNTCRGKDPFRVDVEDFDAELMIAPIGKS